MSNSTSSTSNGLEAAALGSPAGLAPTSWIRQPLRRLLARLLRSVHCGSIAVELPNGERVEGRGAAEGPHASIRLHRWRPLARMLLRGDIGLAESYRDGDWSSHDLTALLEFGIRNEAGWGRVFEASLPARWFGRAVHRMRANTRRGSRQNISFHYDMGNAFNTEAHFCNTLNPGDLPKSDPCDQRWGLRDLRYSAGFGFRWQSPIGPLRFEWGFPLDRQRANTFLRRGDDPVVFEFAIGNSF